MCHVYLRVLVVTGEQNRRKNQVYRCVAHAAYTQRLPTNHLFWPSHKDGAKAEALPTFVPRMMLCACWAAGFTSFFAALAAVVVVVVGLHLWAEWVLLELQNTRAQMKIILYNLSMFYVHKNTHTHALNDAQWPQVTFGKLTHTNIHTHIHKLAPAQSPRFLSL